MLAYLLAAAVMLLSLALYMAAFLFPESGRKSDFFWSGLGFFYGLVLWICAGRITGGVLLGQVAGVALLGWFGVQTLSLRRLLTPAIDRTEISPQIASQLEGISVSKLGEWASQLGTRLTNQFRRQSSAAQPEPTPPANQGSPTVPATSAQPPSQPATPPSAGDGEETPPPRSEPTRDPAAEFEGEESNWDD